MNKQQKTQSQANKYVSEFIRCKNDFNYFCSNYVYVELPGGDILLNLYEKQRELADLVQKEHFAIVLKSRQIGCSAVFQAYSAWLLTFFANTVIGIISKDGKESTNFARNIRGIIEKLPRWMKPIGGSQGPGFSKKQEQSFALTNGSKLFAAPVAPNYPEKCLRGQSITFLVVDEAAFVGKMDSAWTSLVPALATSQKNARIAGVPYGTVLLSTPNKVVGIGAWYYKHWTNAISGDSIFKPFIIHWKMIPELADDPEWYSNQCKLFDNDQRKIQQELEMKFLATEGSFFSSATVEKIQESASKAVIMEKIKIFNGEIWKFANPIPGEFYLIGVDSATQYGEDKSAITVWNYSTLEQVWEFYGKCKVLDFVKIVKVCCQIYRNSTVIIESNSCGNQVREEINESPELSTLIYKEKRGENTLVPGISTTAKNRPLMIDALYSYITEFPEIVKSERLALELSGLISKPNGRIEADIGCHDDLAMSSAFSFYVRKYDSSRLMIDTEKNSEQSVEMTKIININQDVLSLDEFSNPDIMAHIKNNIGDFGGITDILDLYSTK